MSAAGETITVTVRCKAFTNGEEEEVFKPFCCDQKKDTLNPKKESEINSELNFEKISFSLGGSLQAGAKRHPHQL